MALTGLEIYKLLPKTNCKKCGFPTCLAFAMALAAKKVALEKCPDVSEETKRILQEASEPPIRTVTIAEKYKVGGETVLFRHEKTFYNPCIIGMLIKDTFSDTEIDRRINIFNSLVFDRVGKKYNPEMVFVKIEDSSSQENIEKIKNVITKFQGKETILALGTENPDVIPEIMKIRKIDLIGFGRKNNIEKFVNIAKEYNVPLIVSGENLDDIVSIVNTVVQSGYREILLDIPVRNNIQVLEYLTQIRKLALKKNFRPFGYPTFLLIDSEDINETLVIATTGVLKYASVLVLNNTSAEVYLSLITLRLNIYTDPQKPVIVEPKLYKVGGEPTPDSPLLVTTNFSLTYYSVEPEIINSKIPSWLLIVDTDGLSVLTAWAAEKFTAEKVVDAIKKHNVEQLITHKTLIIPGYVAVMSGKLNDLLSDWKIIVGPKEASGIPKFLKTLAK